MMKMSACLANTPIPRVRSNCEGGVLLAFRFYAAFYILYIATWEWSNWDTAGRPRCLAQFFILDLPSRKCVLSLQSLVSVALCCGCKFVEEQVQCNKKDKSFLYRVNITAIGGGGDWKHPSCGEQKTSARPVITDRMVSECSAGRVSETLRKQQNAAASSKLKCNLTEHEGHCIVCTNCKVTEEHMYCNHFLASNADEGFLPSVACRRREARPSHR